MTDAPANLTVLDGETPESAPAHDSTHACVDAPVAALEAILRDASEGDRTLYRDDETRPASRTYVKPA
ncbi:hypothetical protein Br6_05131 [Rhodococcus sp. Br-6]|nr:hypothetical protein Br6_05131 [Rhodococcus sp. Br-6]